MVRVKALKLFNDGWEKKLRYPGEIFEATQERYERWHSASLVVAVENEQPDLDSMIKTQLMDYAKESGLGLDDKMRKAEMIAAIKGAMGWM